MLGVRSSLRTAATMVDLADPVGAFEEAAAAGLLRVADDLDFWYATFPHPLIQAAVYENVTPGKRIALHRLAASLLEDAGSALRHLVAAAPSPDPDLADRLDAFAHREMRWGAWASAGLALMEASRLSREQTLREERLLRAVDAIVSAGDLTRVSMLSKQIAAYAPGPLREAALGYLAILHGRVDQAQARLSDGWRLAESSGDSRLQALLALRWTLYSVGRLRGVDVVEWSRRAIDLVPDDEAVRLEAEALHGLGLGLMGQVREGLAAYDAVLGSVSGDEGSIVGRLTMARGWLQIVVDDLDDVPEVLAKVAPAQLRGGSVRIAVWSYVWLSRAHFLRGEWDHAMTAADRAVSVLEETEHAWLRPLARWVAAEVCANRGDRAAAQEHVARAVTDDTDCELMIVAAALAAAESAWARGDHPAVLAALEPVRFARPPREGIDEPGMWPWPHLYADALVGVEQLDEAEAFLDAHRGEARRLGRRSGLARLARVRGRLLTARGQLDEAEAAFRDAIEQLGDLPLPFDRALIELAHGQLLRRRGRRREAYRLLHAARDRFARLDARPHLDRCTVELEGSGLTYASRDDFDPARLTRQELAIARLAATGLRTREIAQEMSISVKTVQFHLGNIYPKLGVHSRLELAQRMTVLGSEMHKP